MKRWAMVLWLLGAAILLLGAGDTPGVRAASGIEPVGSYFVIHDDTSLQEITPAVAYSPTRHEYLAVWVNDRAGCDDIRAQRLRSDGAKVGGPFYIAADCTYNRDSPDVAYYPYLDQYLVVYRCEDNTGFYGICARRITSNGTLIDAIDQPVRATSSLSTPGPPAVAYASTSDRYFVVWAEAFHPTVTTDIVGQLLWTTLAADGGVRTISDDTGGDPRMNPDIAYNRSRNEFLVAWEQESGGQWDVFARQVTGSGEPLSPASITIDNSADDQRNPAVAAIPTVPNYGSYLVVYDREFSSTDRDIYARKVNGDGSTGSIRPISIPAYDEYEPAIAGDGTSRRYLAAWRREDYAPGQTWDGMVAWQLDIEGTQIGDLRIIGGKDAEHVSVAAGSAGDYLMVYDDQLAATRAIVGALLGRRTYLPTVLRNQ
jgi:hypothetical protein